LYVHKRYQTPFMRKYLFVLLLLTGCRAKINTIQGNVGTMDTAFFALFPDPVIPIMELDTGIPEKIVAFAKTQIGVPYKYCSMTPGGGFDCSGFVNYVFNHFAIAVPRASVGFTNIGREIQLSKTRPGDLILFTGTNPHSRVVGHIGIIIANDHGEISFIQSTSGIAYGVVISALDKNYMSRFVKVIRIVE
jgi:cell wall-associated NlpC family hydrolase